MDIASIITTAASAVGVIIALWAVWVQTRQNNRALGVNILRDLEKEFHWSEEIRIKRLTLANFLQGRKPSDPRSPEVNYMLDFFDSIGLYHNKGVIDTEMTWVMFYYWLGHYWQLLKQDAHDFELQEGGLIYYKNVRLLYKHLTHFGRKHRNLPEEETYYSTENLQSFLADEIENCSPQSNQVRSKRR